MTFLFNMQVGLRWWNYIDENGDSQWMFEKRNGDSVHLLSATEVLSFYPGITKNWGCNLLIKCKFDNT